MNETQTERTFLVIAYDVTGFSRDEIENLTGEAWAAQGEANHDDPGHGNVNETDSRVITVSGDFDLKTALPFATKICPLHDHDVEDLHDPLLCLDGGDCDTCAPQNVGIVLNDCGVGIQH